MENLKLTAKTFFGLEEILEKELRNLGAIDIDLGVRCVNFKGDLGFLYKSNLFLRTAIRILMPIHECYIKNETDLYKQLYNLPWEDWIQKWQTFAIDATLYSEDFTHTQFISLKTKDAIVDRFRNKTGARPDVDTRYPDVRINVHIQDKYCTVSLDSSGSSLHQRGYKTQIHKAPINEVLAAGLLLLSGWRGESDFLDPMCGSGTIAIEAALIACNLPPNLHREKFCFKNWRNFDEDLFEKIKESCLKKAIEYHYQIKGYDISQQAVFVANNNVLNAIMEDYIQIEVQDFFTSEKQRDAHLHMLFNPPYDERMSIDDSTDFYKSIGDTLKQQYPNTQSWLITSNLEALKYVGLRPSRKIRVFNAKLDSRLVRYDIYKGSKKAKYNDI